VTGPERETPSPGSHRPGGAGSGAPPARARPARGRRAGIAALVLSLVVAGALVAGWLVSARGLMEVQVPGEGDGTVGAGGLELLVRFPEPARVESSTFRALLNGADVTGELEVAANGAHGRLHGFLDGPNELRVAVFGRPWWAAWAAETPLEPWLPLGARELLVEASQRIPLRYRGPTDWDRG